MGGAGTTATSAPPRRLPVLALLTANAVSQTGNVLTMLAVPWFVLETTGSPVKTGLTLFATTLPMVIAGIFGGALVDRTGFKRMSVLSDLASGVTVALIPLLYHTVGLAFWQLLTLVFLGTLLDAPGETARRSLLPDLARLAGMPLERANAATQAIQRGSRLLGAPLAGLLIATAGADGALWLDALTFAASAAIVAIFVPSVHGVARSEEPYLRQIGSGIRFIWSDRLIRTLVLSVALTNALDAPLAVAFPVYAKEVYGTATALGLMVAGGGAGALIGTTLYGAVGHRLPRRAVFIGGFIAAGLPLWLLVPAPPLWVAVLRALLTGIAAAPLNPVLDTVFQERVPVALRGRVFGTITAIAWLAMPLGVLAGGLLLDAFGVRPTIAGIATCYLVATVSLLFLRSLRQMDARADAARDSAAVPA
jgi:MFS family permease